MAVYYKFKSARDYDSIAMDGPFISVGILKEKIFESKHLGRGTDFDLVVTNAQTNEGWFDLVLVIPFLTSFSNWNMGPGSVSWLKYMVFKTIFGLCLILSDHRYLEGCHIATLKQFIFGLI